MRAGCDGRVPSGATAAPFAAVLSGAHDKARVLSGATAAPFAAVLSGTHDKARVLPGATAAPSAAVAPGTRHDARVRGSVLFLLLLAPALALPAASAFADDNPRDAWRADTRAAIPRLAKAPTIDGTVEDAEWSGAFACDGVLYPMTVNLFPRRAQWRLGWDDAGLYVASHTPRLAGEEPVANADEPQRDALRNDDSFELFVYTDDGRSSVHLAINPDGVLAVQLKVNGKDTDPASILAKAALSAKHLDYEAHVPFAALGVEGAKAGDRWRILPVRNFRHNTSIEAPMPYNHTGGIGGHGASPLFTLTDGPFVQVQPLQASLFAGTPAARMQLVNPSGKMASAIITARVTKADELLGEAKREAPLEPKSPMPLLLPLPLDPPIDPNVEGEHRFFLDVTLPDGTELFHTHFVWNPTENREWLSDKLPGRQRAEQRVVTVDPHKDVPFQFRRFVTIFEDVPEGHTLLIHVVRSEVPGRGFVTDSLQHITCVDPSGKKDGIEAFYRVGHELEHIVTYRQGVRHGPEKFLDTGKNAEGRNVRYVQKIIPWVDGQVQGTQRVYHPTGELLAEAQYVDGRCVGVAKRYDPDGRLTRETPYQDNLKHGEMVEYYARRPQRIETLRDGVVQGEATEYDWADSAQVALTEDPAKRSRPYSHEAFRNAFRADTRLAAPAAGGPVTVDGRFADGEWDRAAAVAAAVDGETGGLSPHDVTWRFAWDADYLYVSARTPLLAGETLGTKSPSNSRPPAAVAPLTDDETPPSGGAFEVRIVRGDGKASLRAMLSSAGVAVRCEAPDRADDAPLPAVLAAAGARGGALEIEFAIPLTDLGLGRGNRRGDSWGVLVQRHFGGAHPGSALLPCDVFALRSARNDARFYPRLSLRDDWTAVSAAVPTPALVAGQPASSLTLQSPPHVAASANVRMRLLRGGMQVGLHEAKVQCAAKGGSAQWTEHIQPDRPGEGDFPGESRFDLTVTDGRTELFHTHLTYDPLAMAAEGSPAPAKTGQPTAAKTGQPAAAKTGSPAGAKGALQSTVPRDAQHRRSGTQRICASDGTLLLEIPWDKGVLHGLRRAYRPDGSLLAETPYENGLPSGRALRYDPEGRVVASLDYVRGIADGRRLAFWPRRVQRTAPYDRGRLSGDVKDFWDNGQRKSVRPFRDDLLHGIETQYDETGKPTQTRYWWEGDLVSESEYAARIKQ